MSHADDILSRSDEIKSRLDDILSRSDDLISCLDDIISRGNMLLNKISMSLPRFCSFMDLYRYFVCTHLYMYLEQTTQIYYSYINECSSSFFIARMVLTVPFSYGKLSLFSKARDALILYIFDDETDLYLFLLI